VCEEIENSLNIVLSPVSSQTFLERNFDQRTLNYKNNIFCVPAGAGAGIGIKIITAQLQLRVPDSVFKLKKGKESVKK
jgi:hypothetical protein